MIKDLENQIITTCRFCNPPEKERIIFETANFYVMLSLGPIVEGYCLLVSKQHYLCCAAIPTKMQNEFKKIYYETVSILKKTYEHCIVYEHGRAGSCLVSLEGSKHCYHSHMHFVPVPIPLNNVVSKDLDPVNLVNLDSFFKVYEANQEKPYLFIDDSKSINFYKVDHPIRRQYLRFKIAVSVDKRELWNWVQHQGWDLIKSGHIRLSNQFKAIQNDF